MSMSKDTLKEGLLAIGNQSSEAAAISAWVDAYTTYVLDAVAGVVPITGAAVDTAGEVMAASLIGMSDYGTGAGLTRIPAAILAFWTALAVVPSATFTGATAMVFPSHTGLPTDFAVLMVENVTATDTESALEALADLLHEAATKDGTVTFLSSPVPIE